MPDDVTIKRPNARGLKFKLSHYLVFARLRLMLKAMNAQELLQLLLDVESDRVERKASLSDPERIREAMHQMEVMASN